MWSDDLGRSLSNRVVEVSTLVLAVTCRLQPGSYKRSRVWSIGNRFERTLPAFEYIQSTTTVAFIAVQVASFMAWYVGPLGKSVGADGGDIANEFTFMVTDLIHIPSRSLGKKMVGR